MYVSETNLSNVFIPPCLGPSGVSLEMAASLEGGTRRLGVGLVSMSPDSDMTQCHKNELSRCRLADG